MSATLPPELLLCEAVAFAARVHRHMLRKDGQTPYVSHVVRVGLVVRQVFGFDDPRMLAAAFLHDTIEDTNTDYDDLCERFGPVVAGWVATLTKDMRLPHDDREAAYIHALATAEWPVKVIKLADIYDNLNDSQHLAASAQRQTFRKSRRYLEALRVNLPPEAQVAWQLVERRLQECEVRSSE
ncbi:MAG: HD domain-containing protein [Gemmataceae bacterium]|nr:HD domain-containing protein [Gemmata sp.]MDW8198644.1 HD domain-containing protein [Gemmataceae bacterium]